MVQCKFEVTQTLQVFEDMTLEIIFLLERAEQDTSFQMSVGINMSAPLSAVKESRVPSGKILHLTGETRDIYSKAQGDLSQNCLDFAKRGKTEQHSYAIGKLYFKIRGKLLPKYN
jgi:hypothetical protein